MKYNYSLALRLLLVGISALLLANTKHVNSIPRHDNPEPPPPFEVRAEQAYKDGVTVHDQATSISVEAAAAEKARKRLEAKAHKRYGTAIARFEQALTMLGQAETENPPYLHDLLRRMSDAYLATGNTAGAQSTLQFALEMRPDDLATLYTLARLQLQQHELDPLRETYAHILTEAEVYGEAWGYIDKLLAQMKSAVRDPAFSEQSNARAFAAWLDEQVADAAETVRWSALPD